MEGIGNLTDNNRYLPGCYCMEYLQQLEIRSARNIEFAQLLDKKISPGEVIQRAEPC